MSISKNLYQNTPLKTQKSLDQLLKSKNKKECICAQLKTQFYHRFAGKRFGF